MINPFVTNGYAGEAYFCDRVQETKDITAWLLNGNNIALISPRRYGKTDLMRHCFEQNEIKKRYYTFIIDIYSTKSLSEMVNKMGRVILDELKPKGKQHWEAFLNMMHSLKTGITYDAMGQPSWNVSVGDIANPNNTLDEIFHYLQHYVQYCSNANFVFLGSQRHLMGSMFVSPNRPFYQSVTVMNLNLIDEEKYWEFCNAHFEKAGKTIDRETVRQLYAQFEGVTFYLQKVMNVLFMRTAENQHCTINDLQSAVDYIIDFTNHTYEDLMYQLPEKQSLVLRAIAKEGKVKQITSGKFAKHYGLISPSAVKSAVNALLDKDLITQDKGVYQVYDKFLEIWLKR